MSRKIREVNTYNIALQIMKVKPYEGNTGPQMQYAYTYFPHIISLREGIDHFTVTLTGSTPNSIGIVGMNLGAEPIVNDSDMKISDTSSIKYERGKTSEFSVTVVDTKSTEKNKSFNCDPQVQNSRPVGPLPSST